MRSNALCAAHSGFLRMVVEWVLLQEVRIGVDMNMDLTRVIKQYVVVMGLLILVTRPAVQVAMRLCN
jgi:hypothetical protein